MSRDHLAIRCRTDFCIFFAACLFCIVINKFVKGATTFHNSLIVVSQFFESIEDSHFAIMLPIAHTLLVHILNRVNVIITKHHESFFPAIRDRTEIVNICHSRIIFLFTSCPFSLCSG